MSLFNQFDKDSILWFIILFLLLFWCGKGCEDECCEETMRPGCKQGYMGGHNQGCC